MVVKESMPAPPSKPPIASTLATLASCIIVFASLLLPVVFPKINIGIAITIGAVLGAPFIVLGLWLHPKSDSGLDAPKQFLPTRIELRETLWSIFGFVTILVCIFAPTCIFGALIYALPAGDGWGIVLARITCVLLAVCFSIWWFKFAAKTIPERFRGRIPDKALDLFKHEVINEEPAKKPTSAWAAIINNWHVALIAATAFCVASEIIDLNSPWLNLDVGPKRFRGIARILAWCRGNPNTVTSSSWLVGIGALVVFVARIRKAHKRGQMTSSNSGM